MEWVTPEPTGICWVQVTDRESFLRLVRPFLGFIYPYPMGQTPDGARVITKYGVFGESLVVSPYDPFGNSYGADLQDLAMILTEIDMIGDHDYLYGHHLWDQMTIEEVILDVLTRPAQLDRHTVLDITLKDLMHYAENPEEILTPEIRSLKLTEWADKVKSLIVPRSFNYIDDLDKEDEHHENA